MKKPVIVPSLYIVESGSRDPGNWTVREFALTKTTDARYYYLDEYGKEAYIAKRGSGRAWQPWHKKPFDDRDKAAEYLRNKIRGMREEALQRIEKLKELKQIPILGGPVKAALRIED